MSRRKVNVQLAAGAEVRYCGDLYEVIGEDFDGIVIKPIDPEIGMHLTVAPGELRPEAAPSRWRWLFAWLQA